LNATSNSVSGCAADKQAHGSLPVCKRGWCHSGLTAFEVIVVVSIPSTVLAQTLDLPHNKSR